MRKYFLTSAVALLSISTANATTDYAEVTAKATIEVAGTFSCSEINYGTIVVKQKNGAFDILGNNLSSSGGYADDLISITGVNSATSTCTATIPDSVGGYVELKNSNGDKIGVEYHGEGSTNLYSFLSIPAEVKAGEYEGSFTLTLTQE
ncbi:MAG: hypothetical protein E7016_02460 [Alphaproteobacteria bacterium]|nr:hypothetical protein [Alphaproteobacteria bacterium]